jgi:hypothetical protein
LPIVLRTFCGLNKISRVVQGAAAGRPLRGQMIAVPLRGYERAVADGLLRCGGIRRRSSSATPATDTS